MKVIIRFLFFLILNFSFSFANDGFGFFSNLNSDYPKEQQKKLKKRPFSEMEEEQKEEGSRKRQFSPKAKLEKQLDQISMYLSHIHPDYVNEGRGILKDLLEKRWFFDAIKQLALDVDYSENCCSILKFIGRNLSYSMADRLYSLEILDTTRAPFFSFLLPHQEALQVCFLISQFQSEWEEYLLHCQTHDKAILNFRVVQYINDFIKRDPSTFSEDFLKCLNTCALNYDLPYVTRERACELLLQSRKQEFYLPVYISIAQNPEAPIIQRRKAVLALIRESIIPEVISVCREVLGSDYFDELMRVDEKIKAVGALLNKVQRDNRGTNLKSYLVDKYIKLAIRNKNLWDLFNGPANYEVLHLKRRNKEFKSSTFISGRYSPFIHPSYLSVKEKGGNYVNLINFINKNPDDVIYRVLKIDKKKQLIDEFKKVLLESTLATINFYPFYQDAIQSFNKQNLPSLAIIDPSFDLHLWPHSQGTHVAKTKSAKKEKIVSVFHGTKVAQTAFNIFEKWGTRANLITMNSEGAKYITDTKELSKRIFPSTTFTMSYGEGDVSGSVFNRLIKNFESLISGSDRLLVCSAGNKGIIIDEESNKQLRYLNHKDILDHLIFAGWWNMERNSLDSHSNRAGPYKDHFVIAPGIYLGIPTHIQKDYPYLSHFEHGTSYAAPAISGSISILRALFPQADFKVVKEAILTTARKNFLGYTPEIHGQGILDMYQAYLFLKKKFPPL